MINQISKHLENRTVSIAYKLTRIFDNPKHFKQSVESHNDVEAIEAVNEAKTNDF